MTGAIVKSAIIILCMLSAAGCGERSQTRTELTSVQQISFAGENISLEEYGALIEFYEQLSFEGTVIEDSDDFAAAAREHGLERLCALHDMIVSLTPSERGEFHSQALEAFGNLQ